MDKPFVTSTDESHSRTTKTKRVSPRTFHVRNAGLTLSILQCFDVSVLCSVPPRYTTINEVHNFG
ncbi:hypothetical protein KIN20_003803 [Parelaphostrongylus tenuis]|uniref:Uncharacterized protein n=1 Tax=Parelaphostrongylus tenuis TaxID=148309 RepID=A0AAD5QIU7_PARTN|nr:hypothetical protein KIN20_003803 [Parelaphostrongylus tenuis]